MGPDLDPEGLVLQPQELGPGIYTLMANQPPKDNNGIIVGSRAALGFASGRRDEPSHRKSPSPERARDLPFTRKGTREPDSEHGQLLNHSVCTLCLQPAEKSRSC